MKFDYKIITLEEIESYMYYCFICDGDKKKVIALPKREDYK